MFRNEWKITIKVLLYILHSYEVSVGKTLEYGKERFSKKQTQQHPCRKRNGLLLTEQPVNDNFFQQNNSRSVIQTPVLIFLHPNHHNPCLIGCLNHGFRVKEQ